jgi:hypothetical protein
LANGLKETYSCGHRYVETLYSTGHGNPYKKVAPFPGQAPESLSLGPHDNRQRTSQIRLIQGAITGRIGTDNPETSFLQFLQGTGEISYPNQWNLLGSTAGNCSRHVGQGNGTIPRRKNRFDSGRIRRPKASAKVVRVLYLIEHKEKR